MSDTSIRTPAWGVTHQKRLADRALHISIRTPAWGVTYGILAPVRVKHFNSHPRVGGDEIGETVFTTVSVFQFTPPRGG